MRSTTGNLSEREEHDAAIDESAARKDGARFAETDEASADAAYVAPRTAIEAAVADIWATLLNLERVGIRDNFVLLGGESLMAVQVASRVRDQFGVDVSLRAIFVGTVADVAAEIESAQTMP